MATVTKYLGNIGLTHSNARSICNQLIFIQTFTYVHNPDIVCLTETWLKDFIFDNEFLPPNYTIYRNDHKDRGWGVLLAVKSHISSNLIHSPDDIEMSISVRTLGTNLTVTLLYILPNADQSYFSRVQSLMGAMKI